MPKGKQLAGGELEAIVMDVLWDRGGWMTPGEVQEVVNQTRPLAYNTVQTILGRLFEKDRLERQRDGRAYAYRPTQSRARHAASRMESVLRDLKDRPEALAHFVESLPDADRTQLRRSLDRLRGVG